MFYLPFSLSYSSSIQLFRSSSNFLFSLHHHHNHHISVVFPPLPPQHNRSFPSSFGPPFQNEDRCSAFDMEIIFHSHANKTYFHKKGCAPSLILKARVFRTRKCPVRFHCILFMDQDKDLTSSAFMHSSAS